MKSIVSYSGRGLLLVLVLSGLLLGGCGQKGPLYLPDEDTEKQQKKSAG